MPEAAKRITHVVFTRHIDEEIEIGPDIKVKIHGVRGGAVRIGIEAPEDVPVHRQEVADAIRREARDQETKP